MTTITIPPAPSSAARVPSVPASSAPASSAPRSSAPESSAPSSYGPPSPASASPAPASSAAAASGPLDPPGLLLDVERVLGYRPESSIVLRIHRRRRLFALLRVDLPPADVHSADADADADADVDADVHSAGADAADIHSAGADIDSADADSVDADADADSADAGSVGPRAVGATPLGSVPGAPPDDLARGVTGLVARVAGAESVDLVLFDHPSGAGRVPEAEARLPRVVDSIAKSLELAGYPLNRVLVVSAGRWSSLSAAAPESGGAPRGFRWRTLPAPPATSPSGRRDPHHGPFVPIEPASERRRGRAMAALAELQRPEAGTEPDAVDQLLRWQAVLSPSAAPPSDARCIALAWSLRHRLVRDSVLMQCAWGLEAGILALSDLVVPPAPASAGRSAASGASAPAKADPAIQNGPPESHSSESDDLDSKVATSFLGISDDAPLPARVRKAIEVLRGIAEVAPDALAAAPLTMLAWLEWSRGRGTAAGGYLDAALTADPGYMLARLFHDLLHGGATPLWLDPVS